MENIGHWIDGAQVAGSGRTADVFNPSTGEVQARVALAGKAELDRAVEIAAAAQPAWEATNPQRRARVLMKFVDLLNRDMDKLAEALSREHGKTLPDAKGDVQRGLEVVEFCIGAPHHLKGEFTDSAGPGIDMYSMRQALGVTAGITPFNFPAMIPMWMFAPAIASGNAFILKPSERDPSVPMMLAKLLEEAGLPKGILQVVNGDKEAVDAILDHRRHPVGRFRRLDPDRGLYLRTRIGERQAGAMFRRGQEPHDHHARRRHGSGRRCAGRGRVRRGRRTLHGDFGGCSRGRRHRRPSDRQAGSSGRGAEGRALYLRRRRRFRSRRDGGGQEEHPRTDPIRQGRGRRGRRGRQRHERAGL